MRCIVYMLILLALGGCQAGKTITASPQKQAQQSGKSSKVTGKTAPQAKAEVLVKGSGITVAASTVPGKFMLSNGRSISAQTLGSIRKISHRFENAPEIAELLTDMEITRGTKGQSYIIAAAGLQTIKPYIILGASKPELRLKLEYRGKTKLFTQGYEIKADNYSWQSPPIKFKRDHKTKQVREWIDVPASGNEFAATKILVDSKRSTIRFRGNGTYSDTLMSEEEKQNIKRTLKLYQLMQ